MTENDWITDSAVHTPASAWTLNNEVTPKCIYFHSEYVPVIRFSKSFYSHSYSDPKNFPRQICTIQVSFMWYYIERILHYLLNTQSFCFSLNWRDEKSNLSIDANLCSNIPCFQYEGISAESEVWWWFDDEEVSFIQIFSTNYEYYVTEDCSH